MNNRRVVVTGCGVISCVGNNLADFWDSLVNGRCGLGKVTRFDTSEYRTRIAGEVKDFDVTKYMTAKEAKRLDLFCQYAIAASDEAMEMAGLPKELRGSGIDANRVGVIVSSGIGGLQTMSDQDRILQERGPGKVSPLLIPMMIGDLASGNISIRYGAGGPNLGLVTACSTGCHSIGEAFWDIKRDDADIMICGGAEASVVPLGMAGFCSMKAMSQRNDDPPIQVVQKAHDAPELLVFRIVLAGEVAHGLLDGLAVLDMERILVVGSEQFSRLLAGHAGGKCGHGRLLSSCLSLPDTITGMHPLALWGAKQNSLCPL